MIWPPSCIRAGGRMRRRNSRPIASFSSRPSTSSSGSACARSAWSGSTRITRPSPSATPRGTTADPSTGSINSQDPAGYGRVSDPTELERGTRALSVLDTLKNTAEFLGSVRGRRKALLFFSEGLDYPDSRRVRRTRCDDGHSRESGRHLHGRARQREFLRGRSSRPRRNDHATSWKAPGSPTGPVVPGPSDLVPGTNTPSQRRYGGLGRHRSACRTS